MRSSRKHSARVTAALLAAGMVLSSVSPVCASEITSVVQESEQSESSSLPDIPSSEDPETSETDPPAEPPAESTDPTIPPTAEENPGQDSDIEDTDPTVPSNPDDQPETNNPDSSEENTPPESTEDTSSDPDADTPSDPAEDISSEIVEDMPSEADDEESDDTDITVLDTSWLNHINYGKYFFNTVDMRKGFARIDKVYAYANVTDYLNVREKAAEKSRIVGTLSPKGLCYVIADSDKEWVYIESEDVRGFVKNEYLQQGEEALNYVLEIGEENMETATLLIHPEDNKAFTYSYETVYDVVHGTGEGVIRFADQFVGNSYILGGNSLTHGIDSSHFIYQILSRCGVYDGPYTTPHGWRCIGEEVASLDDAQAGDIICYQSHIALYDGGGRIVEAQGRLQGITHDREADNSEIVTIRRLIPTSNDEENAQIICEYLLSNGFSKAGAAGILANIANESYPAFEPSSLELSSVHKSGFSSDQYTAMVDNGKISKKEFIVSSTFGVYSGGKYGYGLCGFTDPKVKAYVYHYTVEQGKSVGSISGQLDSLLAYLSEYNPGLLSRLKNATDPEAAAAAFLKEYERPANLQSAEIKRTSAARSIYTAIE